MRLKPFPGFGRWASVAYILLEGALGHPRSTFPSFCLLIFLFKMPVIIVFGICNAEVLEYLLYKGAHF